MIKTVEMFSISLPAIDWVFSKFDIYMSYIGSQVHLDDKPKGGVQGVYQKGQEITHCHTPKSPRSFAEDGRLWMDRGGECIGLPKGQFRRTIPVLRCCSNVNCSNVRCCSNVHWCWPFENTLRQVKVVSVQTYILSLTML